MATSQILDIMREFLKNNPTLNARDAQRHAIEMVKLSMEAERMMSFDYSHLDAIDVTPVNNKKIVKKEFIEKQYTKEDLKIDPSTAINEEYIECCLCEKNNKNKYQSLTSTHLKSKHSISKEQYLNLCGYDKKTRLMSHKNSTATDDRIKTAQEARSTHSE